MMLTFVEGTHQYFYDGKEVPSVSRFLKETGIAPGCSFYDANSASRGTDVHKMTEAIDKGIMSLDDVGDYEHRGYVEAWELFKRDTGFKSMAIEQRIFSQLLWLAGTVDRIGSTFALGAITLDIKTGQKQGWHKYQLAAYNMIMGVRNLRVCVYLCKTGKYKISTFSDDTDYTVISSNVLTFRKRIQGE